MIRNETHHNKVQYVCSVGLQGTPQTGPVHFRNSPCKFFRKKPHSKSEEQGGKLSTLSVRIRRMGILSMDSELERISHLPRVT